MVEAAGAGKKFLVHFIKRHKYLDFCIQELEALANLTCGYSPEQLLVDAAATRKQDCKQNPMIYVNLPSEEVAKEMVSRAVLTKQIIDPLAEASSFEDLLNHLDVPKFETLMNADKSFMFKCEGIGRKIKLEERDNIIESFGRFDIPENPRIDLKNPDITFTLIENKATKTVYFGREVACSKVDEKGEPDFFYSRFDLTKRPYLGPTTCDHTLAFLMANQGQVKPGDWVYDPFVGTAGIATAVSYFTGSNTFGSDIDIRVLQGYGVGRKTYNKLEGLDKIERFDVWTNFKHYKLPKPQVWIQDCAKPMLARGGLFDAIICDPPYGHRARSKKVGVSQTKKEKQPKPEPEDKEGDEWQPHYSMKEHYDFQKVYNDLLVNSAWMLKPGGLLVFLYHTDESLPPEKNEFPTHEQFEFLRSSINPLTKSRARHLITMRKKA